MAVTIQHLTLHGFALAGAVFSPQMAGATVLRPETAASVVWKSSSLTQPTSFTPLLSASAIEAVDAALTPLSLAALAASVFKDSRDMQDWEKDVADDFFLSHFR